MLKSVFNLLFSNFKQRVDSGDADKWTWLSTTRGSCRIVVLNQALKQLNAWHFISGVGNISSKVYVAPSSEKQPVITGGRNAAASTTAQLAASQLSASQRMQIHCNECRHWNGNSALHRWTKGRVRQKKQLILRLKHGFRWGHPAVLRKSQPFSSLPRRGWYSSGWVLKTTTDTNSLARLSSTWWNGVVKLMHKGRKHFKMPAYRRKVNFFGRSTFLLRLGKNVEMLKVLGHSEDIRGGFDKGAVS